MRAIAQRGPLTSNGSWHVLLDPDDGIGSPTLIAVYFEIPHLHQSAEVNARNAAEEYNARLECAGVGIETRNFQMFGRVA